MAYKLMKLFKMIFLNFILENGNKKGENILSPFLFRLFFKDGVIIKFIFIDSFCF